MTIKNRFPDVAPVLNLDFANTKRLDPRITFTRASTGTYVDEFGIIRTAAANQARFDHDGSGNSLGLLIEEARTNLRTLSANFSTGWSYNANVTVASGQTSPTGDSMASLITLNAGTFQAKLAEKFFGNTTIYARSWFVKKTNQRYIWCGDQNNGNYAPNYRFDLDLGTGTVVSGGGFNSGFTITPYANGYYRISVACISQDIFCISANNTTSVNPLYQSSAHDGTETFVIWGYQIEQASFSTSYIPTSGSTATRSADVASMTGTNFSSWWSSGPSTYYASVISRASNQNNRAILGITGSSTERQVTLSFDVNSATIGTRIDNIFYGSSVSMSPLGIPVKAAGAITSSEVRLSVNGTLGNAGAPPRLATSVPTQMDVGRFLADSQYSLNGTIARLTYYDRRLTDAQLQALTL